MSTGEKEKEPVKFTSKEEHSTTNPIKHEETEEDSNEPRGLILEDGSINWDCPCLGGMVKGPCGDQFREAFSCFHYSKAEPKGSDCMTPFTKMQDCMQKYPEIYGPDEKEDDEDELDEQHREVDSEKPVISNADKASVTSTTNNTNSAIDEQKSNNSTKQKLEKSK